MQITGLRYGKQLLDLVEFPAAKMLTGGATKEEIQELLDESGKVVVKPFFYGGVGKKGKSGLIRIVDNVHDAMKAKEELYFASHNWGAKTVRANGVTFEEYIESDIEVYFSISVSTRLRKPIFIISTYGGVDIETLPPEKKHSTWIDPFIGIKSFDLTNVLGDMGCPQQYISPLVQTLPKLWELYDNYGLTTIELNPIRMKKVENRYVPIGCDLKAAFDQDNPGWRRLGLPKTIFQADVTPFEAEINLLRTYQGQSDVLELNPEGTIVPFMFGGGANSAATETLGTKGIFSSDFGGNPPYDKMYDISRIVFKHWYDQANVLLIIGGKANNTDIYVTFKGMFDALRDHVSRHGKRPIYTVVGRGGPNLIRGMFYGKDILDRLKLPYKMFGYDSSMIGVLDYARQIDDWWAEKGRAAYEKKFKS
ncbi:carboxylate--amine ligase [candidate division KSB1 bacterium]|nr:carboxylate--amine ligase [candidate division KSB1 bacterium]RQW04817.1 MAG: carboxylate--amine ligase [candidate division KSB1 bacterium]